MSRCGKKKPRRSGASGLDYEIDRCEQQLIPALPRRATNPPDQKLIVVEKRTLMPGAVVIPVPETRPPAC